MIKTHQVIKNKLENYPADVQELAIRAIEFADSLPEISVAEQLKSVVRKIIKEKEVSR